MSRYGYGLMGLVLGSLTITANGCQRGPDFTFYPVEGTVTKGGRPLRDIQVIFLSDPEANTVGPRAIGRTDEAGHYRLGSDRGDDGAVVGKHRVVIFAPRWKGTVRGTLENANRLQDQLKKTEDAQQIPSSYGRINETPLRAEVGSKPLVFDIVIP